MIVILVHNVVLYQSQLNRENDRLKLELQDKAKEIVRQLMVAYLHVI